MVYGSMEVEPVTLSKGPLELGKEWDLPPLEPLKHFQMQE